MTVKNLIFAFFPLIVFCISCNVSEKENSMDLDYDLVLVDSFRVERENRIRILDYNSDYSEYLAFDPITNEFVQLDSNGKVLNSTVKYGEGPDEYNTNILAASFNQEQGGFYLQSSNEFIWYSKDWEVKNRLKISAYYGINLYSGPRYNVPYFYLGEDSHPHFYTSFFSGLQVHKFETKEDLSKKMLIEYYNPKNDSLEWGLPFDEAYFSSKELNEKDISPKQIFSLDKKSKLMHLTFQNSKVIGTYEMSKDFQMKEKLEFDHQEFVAANGSRNVALYDLGSENLLLLYHSGLSEGSIQQKKDSNPDYIFYQDPALFRFIVLHKDGSGRQEIMFPASGEPHSEIVQLPNNRILIRKKDNPNTEQEYSDYLVFELK